MPKTKIIYHLSHCSTCRRIIGEVNTKACELRDIKSAPITAEELDHMAALAGSFEALFSRKAVQYTKLALKDKVLSEKQMRTFILSDYTFLKRPVSIIDGQIFIGNTKVAIAALKEALR